MTNKQISQRTLILGAGPFAKALVREIESRPECGYHIVGIVAERAEELTASVDYPLLGTIDDLQDIMGSVRPDHIIATLSEKRGYLPLHKLVEAKFCRNIVVEEGEAVFEELTGQIAIEALTPFGVIFSRDFQPSRFDLVATRVMSLVLAALGTILLAPLFVLIALAIKLDSRGPVLFVQPRVGLSCEKFNLLKFRTMRPDESRKSEWAGDNSHRITRVGRVLRKYRLDELPQFFNVLTGDMNLVGPRPHPASNYELFTLVSRNTPNCGGQIPYYSLRSMVRPGITGWAQVRYRYANNLDEEIEKLRYDLFYVKHYSLWRDLQIIFETIKVVVLGREEKEVNTQVGNKVEDMKPSASAAPKMAAGQHYSANERPAHNHN